MKSLELINIFKLLDRIYTKVEKRSKEALAIDEYNNLTLAEARTIFAIGKDNLKTMREIAEQLRVAPNTATVAVERLISKGLALKEASNEDRRIQQVKLTEKAIGTMEYIDKELMKDTEYVLSCLTDTEVLILKSLLEKIDKNI